MSDTITQGEDLAKFSTHDYEAGNSSDEPNQKLRAHVTGSRQSSPESLMMELEKTALEKCCSLTLGPFQKSCTIEIAHVVPAASDKTHLRTLQEAWHMNDLPDIDSPANLMYLRADWHRAFNADLWTILPTEELLYEIAGATSMPKKRDLFSRFSKCLKDKSPKDKYQLLWLGDSDPAEYPPLLRRKDPQTSNLDSSLVNVANRRNSSLRSNDLQACFPPYTDFPAFHSHVHPFFAIVDAGSKLLGVHNPSRFGPTAEILLEIYRRWFKLPAPVEPPQIAAESDEGDGQSSRTFQMDDDGSSGAHDAQGTGFKSECISRRSGGGSNAQNRAGNEHGVPCDMADVPILNPCNASAGTPSLNPDSSVNVLNSHSLNEAEELEDVDTYVSTWLARVDAAPPQENENSGDRTLDEYDQEPSQQPEPHKWQQWAITPPQMPGLLRDYHDTSKLTSYHWSLYHECVNLMAPTGSHRLPLNAHTPYDPDDVHKYDVWRDDE